MHAERIRAVADFIEANPERFDIEAWFADHGEALSDQSTPKGALKAFNNYYGTTCCIAGAAFHLAVEADEIDLFDPLDWGSFIDKTAAWLGLDAKEQSGRLFFTWYPAGPWSKMLTPPTAEEVVPVLRRIANGEFVL